MKPRFTPCISLNLSLNFLRTSMMGPMSTSLNVVSIAVVFLASTKRRLMVLRRLLIFSGRSTRLFTGFSGLRPGLLIAASTSCLYILPLLPVGLISLVGTFLSAIIAAATGVALTSANSATGTLAAGTSFFGAMASGAASGLGASVSMLPTVSPMASVSPSLATCFTAPACSALISKVAFSLSNSAITSSLSAHSPSFFSHLTRVTSLILSPTVGTIMFNAIEGLFFCEFRLKLPSRKYLLLL